ncbi:MAG: glycosyltransferase [Acidobacteriia bacterium]|nr:glycosyltransferase [Terriglobia bacterium]
MRVALFCHSIISDWNHGNAHFLRGVATELLARGHEVRVFEPRDSWSLANLTAEYGEQPISNFQAAFPQLNPLRYDLHTLDLDDALDGAALVMVHEWNAPELVARIGCHRLRNGRYRLLFHDTHHRSVTERDAMGRYDLSGYDGVLAFGEVIREIYQSRGWSRRVWTWHEAADTRIFRPLPQQAQGDLVWIGNWGDEERTAELNEFLLEPVRRLGIRARVHGVRYPQAAVQELTAAGLEYAGWIANYEVPRVFSGFRATVHIPRRPYVQALPGIPTIRVFEALACGIPLVSAPWEDAEALFTSGRDYLTAGNGTEMERSLRSLLADADQRAALAKHGLETILARHTCAHRVDELFQILECLNN